MPQEVLRQVNFNGGELSPQAIGRRDLKAYGSSLAYAENMIATAEGPLRRRPGLRHVDQIRNRLEAVAINDDTLTAPNGGTVADLGAAGLRTVTPIEALDPYVVLEVDFGVPTAVSLVDLIDFSLITAGGDPGDDDGPAPPQYPWDPREGQVVLP
ncbi:MAG: hypothetical protein ACT6TH_14550 [Brevundimonas sp.]|uniref:hypothetical protein n=1 Tax=Brevundimonas sp. TaxID=1871086 RepID=UPI0040344A14